MKILITGKNGQVGHCLIQQLAHRATIAAFDSQQLDISKRDAVFQTVSAFQPDFIINAAAYTAVDKAETERQRAFAVNADGARHLAEVAQQIGAVLLHISTDYVFDGKGKNPYSENDATNPQNVYGASKLAGEQAVLQACERSIILRTAWVFGAHGNNFVKTMLRLGRERDGLSIVGDQFGAPTAATDIANALIQIAQHISDGKTTEYGIYHFSGSPYVSWFQFAQSIFAEAEKQGILSKIPELKEITTANYPTPAQRPLHSRLALNKIQTAFGIPASNWQQALKQLTDFVEPHRY